MKLANGSISTNNKSISNTHTQYWGKLFQSNSELIQNKEKIPTNPIVIENEYLKNIPTINSKQAKYMASPITSREIYDSITNSPSTSPDPDGFNSNLYKLFPSRFAQILNTIFTYQFSKSKLTSSMQRSTIVLLYKKGDRNEPANYRPINLMNSDVKILSKILAYRLKTVLPFIIHEDQCGFIPNRSIQANIIRLHDIQTNINQNNMEEANVVLLDFQKAFDKVNWNIRNQILKAFNFPIEFIKLIDIIYNNSTIQLNINGLLGHSFQPQAGVKQGDPLSPYLFAIYIEPMAIKLRNTGKEHGITMNNKYKTDIVSLFADDTLLYAKNYNSSIKLIQIVDHYCIHSGMQLNINKSIIVPLYKNSQIKNQNPQSPFKILNNQETTKYLGIQIDPNPNENQQFSNIIKNIHHKLNIWYKRGKTLKGRKTIINTIIKSSLWYYTLCSKISNTTIEPLEKLFINFIKGIYLNKDNINYYSKNISKTNIPTKWFNISYQEGGIEYTNITTQLKILKLKKLIQVIKILKLSNHIPNWIQPFLYQLNTVHPNITKSLDILYLNQHKQRGRIHQYEWKGKLSDHWIEALKTWNQLDIRINYQNLNTDEYYQLFNKQPIWNNKFLLVNKSIPLNRSTRTNQSQKLYKFLQKHIYSFNDIMTNKKFITLQEFKNKFHYYNANYHSINGIYNRIIKLYNDNIQQINYTTSTTLNTKNIDYSKPTSMNLNWEVKIQNVYKSIFKLNTTQLKYIIQNKNNHNNQLNYKIHSDNEIDIKFIKDNFNWSIETKYKKLLLPNIKDLIYRIQLNSIPIGKKFQWTKDSSITTCKFHYNNINCERIETIYHIFWECTFTKNIIQEFMQPWYQIINTNIKWYNFIFQSIPPAFNIKFININYKLLNQFWIIITNTIINEIWKIRNLATFETGNFNQISNIEQYTKIQIIIYIKLQWESKYRRILKNKNTTQLNQFKQINLFFKDYNLYNKFISYNNNITIPNNQYSNQP